MDREQADGGVTLEDGGSPSSAGQAASSGESPYTDEQYSLFEEMLSSPEGRKRLNQEFRKRADAIAVDIRKAMEGDEKARANLGDEGRRLYRTFDGIFKGAQAAWQEKFDAELATLIPSSRAYNQLVFEADNDPEAFAQKMRNPQVRAFYDKWEALGRKYGTQPGQQITQRTAGRIAQDEARESSLDDLYEELRDEDEDGLLTDQDWSQIHPDNFSGVTPREAAKQMQRKLRDLLTDRKAEQKLRPTRERAAAVDSDGRAARAASAAAPPPVGGTTTRRLSDQQIQDAFYNDPTPENRKRYEEMRERLGRPRI